jgi:hypothetical protein
LGGVLQEERFDEDGGEDSFPYIGVCTVDLIGTEGPIEGGRFEYHVEKWMALKSIPLNVSIERPVVTRDLL